MTVGAASAFRLEPLAAAQVDDLVVVEKESFPSPWTRRQILSELDKDYARFESAVHSETGNAVGYCGYWKVESEAQLANLAVHPAWRRRGVGRRLLESAMADARRRGCDRMTLEVRAGAVAALSLYRSLGFRPTGERPRYYEGREAAVLMETRL
ncbi:MAG TPA: ribosomal protein S18-alanine N-acetyltransferase [Elusimicrobiota bacterium]|nr:ribosomal protein S18-alanine N-acetyltransferase [Elusimicrobiota bacterium]